MFTLDMPRRADVIKSAALIVLAVVLATVCIAAVSWRASGGRWFNVLTPSMGQAAPVGTLLLTRPTSVAAIHVGDIITFHPPHSGETYSHRVVGITSAGIHTKGDINPTQDPWVISGQDIVGKVSARWWGMGWVLRGLPLLLLCLAVVWLISIAVKFRRKSPVRIIGTAISVSIVSWLLHPWVGLVKLDSAAARHGVIIRAVSTGILPIRAKPLHGPESVRLVNGQVGSVNVTAPNKHGLYLLNAVPSLTFWWWVAIIAFCLSPLLWCLFVGLPPVPAELPAAAALASDDTLAEPPEVDEQQDDSTDTDDDAGLQLVTDQSSPAEQES